MKALCPNLKIAFHNVNSKFTYSLNVYSICVFYKCISILVQERMTKKIAEAITEAINPTGVGVVIEARYFYQLVPIRKITVIVN